MRRWWLAGVVLTTALGCGGGARTGGSSSIRTATDEQGRTVTTAGGQAVTAEAHDAWRSGLEAFGRYESAGWNEERCEEVRERFEEAAQAQGGRFAEAHYMAGLVAQRCGQNDEARRLFNQALAANDKFCKARVAIGLMQLDAGNANEAFATFQRAVRDDIRCTEGYVNMALIQRRRGGAEVREALANLRRAFAIDSNYLPAFNQMALLYLEQADTNPQVLDLAGVVCRQAQLIDPNYAPIYNTWGLINVRKGNIIEALRFFERATTLDNRMFEAFMNFGQLVASFRGYEDARRAFARAVELRPNDYDARIGLGAALRGLRQTAEAQAEYERAIQIDPNRPEAYFNLGLLYQDYMSGSIEDLERATRYYNNFIQRAGSNPRFASVVEEVRRECRDVLRQQSGRRQRRRSTDCRPGRLQNIRLALEQLRMVQQMQQQAGGAASGASPSSGAAGTPAPPP